MATRKTYENRTQVDVPFSSVPVVSPTITAGKGVTVGPAQVQPSKLLNLANALGTVSRATTTVAGIAELEKKQGLRAGELAAKVEEDANDAFLKMEQAGRKAVEAGTLKESQLPSFQFAFKDGIAKRAAGDYNNALVSKLKRVHENLENGRNGQEYAEELTGETYQEFAERFNNDPILLQSFNTAIQGYNRNFSEQVIRSRDKALKENHKKTLINNSIFNLKDGVTLGNTEDAVKTEAATIHEGFTPEESTDIFYSSVLATYNQLTEGNPTESKYYRTRDLLNAVRDSTTESGIPITHLEKGQKLYFTLSASLDRYREEAEKADSANAIKLNGSFTNELLTHISGYLASSREAAPKEGDLNYEGINKERIFTWLDETFKKDNTDDVWYEEKNEFIEALKNGRGQDYMFGFIRSSDLSEDEKSALYEANSRLGNFVNAVKTNPLVTEDEKNRMGEDAFAMGASGGKYNLYALMATVNREAISNDYRNYVFERYKEGRASIAGTTLVDTTSRSAVKLALDTQLAAQQEMLNKEVAAVSDGTGDVNARTWDIVGPERVAISQDFEDLVNKTITEEVQARRQKDTPLTPRDFRAITASSIEKHVPWLKDQLDQIRGDLRRSLDTAGGITTETLEAHMKSIPRYFPDRDAEVSVFDADSGKDTRIKLTQVSREALLRATTNWQSSEQLNALRGKTLTRRGQEIRIDDFWDWTGTGGYLTKERAKQLRKEVIGYESIGDLPVDTVAGTGTHIDWREVPVFSKAAWDSPVYDFDEEGSILFKTKRQFDQAADQGKAINRDDHPDAYFFKKVLGIANGPTFETFLVTQQKLLNMWSQQGVSDHHMDVLEKSDGRGYTSEEKKKQMEVMNNLHSKSIFYYQRFEAYKEGR